MTNFPSVPGPAPDIAGQPSPQGLLAKVGQLFGSGVPDKQPTNYENDALLLKVLDDSKRNALALRWVYERLWWRNLLYTLGRQWIFYDDRSRTWKDKRLAKWMPKPVTNKISENVETIRALFAAVQFSAIVRPTAQDPQNIATADLCDQLAPILHDEHDMARVLNEADFWLCTTGNAILHTSWDKRYEHDQVLVPFETCQACGQTSPPDALLATNGHCPACGKDQFAMARDQNGQLQGHAIPTGKGITEAISPLEIAYPSYYAHADEIPFLVRMRWRPRAYYEQYYPDLVKTIRWERMPTEKTLQLLQALSTQSDLSTASGTPNISGTGSSAEVEGVSEYELWMKPNEQFDKGLVLRCAQDTQPQIVKESGLPGPLPFETAEGRPLWPWVHAGYQRFGGRVWARSPIDDLVKKQDQLNQLDSLIQLIIQRMANPVWLEPKGAEVEHFTGEPGLVVKWNPLIAGGAAKPERIAGENVPPSLWRLREQLLSDIETVAGTYDVTKGSRPAGVEAFSALQLLVERSQSRFSTAFKVRGEMYRQWLTLALELERQFGQDERTAIVAKPTEGWAYRHFQMADLSGSVTILIEDGSTAPKTNLGKRAAVEQANQLQLLNPTDPDQRRAILQTFGLTDLDPSLDAGTKAALRLQDAFAQWMQGVTQGQADPQACPIVGAVKLWEPHAIFLAEHAKWAMSDDAKQLMAAQPVFEQLFASYYAERQMAAAPPPMPGGPSGSPTPQGGALALANSNQESGGLGDVSGSQMPTSFPSGSSAAGGPQPQTGRPQ